MTFWFLKSGLVSLKIVSQPLVVFRYLRNTKRGGGPKQLKGSVKTVFEQDTDEYEMVQNYQNFIKNVKSAGHSNEIQIEEALANDEDVGTAITQKALHDCSERHDEDYRAFVKKKIIGRKYFKLEIETSLLTHACKEQIRYLHRLDPLQWTPEALSQCFPITVNGAKKLLKSKFVLQSPERIRQHDEEIAKRWEILKSGTPSPLISPYTQHMWDKGKIMKEHYKGNPNLPNMPPINNKTTMKMEEKREVGEYSAIIQQYINYKKKESSPNMLCTSEDLQVCDSSTISSQNKKHGRMSSLAFSKDVYHIDDETDDTDHTAKSYKPRKKREAFNNPEVIHSQFKENLREEMASQKFKADPQYQEWVEKQSTVKTTKTLPNPIDTKKIFSKISKFKKETVELSKEISKDGEHIYLYDEKFGYQHPKGKSFQSKIHIANKSRNKGNLYKLGQSVYDENGEFLYKVPN